MKRFARITLSVLALAGLITSIYLAFYHFRVHCGNITSNGICSLSDTINCITTTRSKWSALFGIPLASFGSGYYLSYLVLLPLSFFTKKGTQNHSQALIILITAFACFFSLFLFYVNIFILKSLCPLCTVLHVINLFSLFLLSPAFEKTSFLSLLRWGFHHLAAAFRSWVLVITLIFFSLPLIALQYYHVIEHTKRNGHFTTQQASYVPHVGDPSAPITIIFFSNYTCPHCKIAHEALERIRNKYPDDIVIYFRFLPFDPQYHSTNHHFSSEATLIAFGAWEQKKFKDINDHLFDLMETAPEQQTLEQYLEIARQHNLNIVKLKKYIKSERAQRRLRQDLDLAKKYNIIFTPTIFINGKIFIGFESEELLHRQVESEKLKIEAATPTNY